MSPRQGGNMMILKSDVILEREKMKADIIVFSSMFVNIFIMRQSSISRISQKIFYGGNVTKKIILIFLRKSGHIKLAVRRIC